MVWFKTTGILLLFISIVIAEQSPGFVQFPVEPLGGNHEDLRRSVHEGLVDGILSQRKLDYALRCTLGTPPQEIRVVLDTSSSDFWVISPDAPACLKGKCDDGSVFNANKSSTFHANDTRFFVPLELDIWAEGVFAQDVLSLGDGLHIPEFNFGYAKESDLRKSVAGIGFSKSEPAYLAKDIGTPYKNLPEQLKEEGLISHVAYSLYLDSYTKGIGSILFGGIDTGAYEGDMYVFPMVPTNYTFVTEPALKLTDLYVVDDDGEQFHFLHSSHTVVFDSGAPFTQLPEYAASTLAGFLGAEYVDYFYELQCDTLANNRGGLGFTIGGVEFVVNFRDLIYELTELRNGTQICLTGFIDGTPERDTFRFGDNILRSLYVVYDLENQEIGVAKAITASSHATSHVALNGTIPGIKAPWYSDTTVSTEFNLLFPTSLKTRSYEPPATIVGELDSTTGLITPYNGFYTTTASEASVSSNTNSGKASSSARSSNPGTKSSNSGSSSPSSRSSSLSSSQSSQISGEGVAAVSTGSSKATADNAGSTSTAGGGEQTSAGDTRASQLAASTESASTTASTAASASGSASANNASGSTLMISTIFTAITGFFMMLA